MLEVKVFVGVPRDVLQTTLRSWLQQVNPIKVFSTSQSESSSDSINLTVFYEKLLR